MTRADYEGSCGKEPKTIGHIAANSYRAQLGSTGTGWVVVLRMASFVVHVLGEAKKKRDERVELTWRDYVALYVALVETVMVPAIVLIVILLLLIIFSSRIR